MNPMRQGVDLFTGWKLKGRRKKKVVQLAMVQKHIGKTIFEFMPSQQKIKPLILFRAIPLLHLLNFSVS
jgi:hypothetical protein